MKILFDLSSPNWGTFVPPNSGPSLCPWRRRSVP